MNSILPCEMRRDEYTDFVEFVRRVEGHINRDNRYGQELRSSFSRRRDRSESIKGKPERQPRVTALATTSDRTRQSANTLPRAPQKLRRLFWTTWCWRFRAFRGAPLSERLRTVRQHKLSRICSHYLIRSSGKNVGENCLWAKSRDTPENRVPGSNKRQPVTEPHINLASTMQKTVNAVTSEVAGESRTVKQIRSILFG